MEHQASKLDCPQQGWILSLDGFCSPLAFERTRTSTQVKSTEARQGWTEGGSSIRSWLLGRHKLGGPRGCLAAPQSPLLEDREPRGHIFCSWHSEGSTKHKHLTVLCGPDTAQAETPRGGSGGLEATLAQAHQGAEILRGRIPAFSVLLPFTQPPTALMVLTGNVVTGGLF